MLTTLILGIFLGTVLSFFLNLFRPPAGAPAQVVTVNPLPAAARPPGCLARLGLLLRAVALGFLLVFFLRLALLS